MGIGVPYLDIVLRTERVPAANESSPMENFTLAGGGKVPTALVAASRLGLSTTLVCGIAEDVFGDLMRKQLEEEGVSLQFATKAEQSALSVIVSDRATASRTILYSQGDVPPSDVFSTENIHAKLLHISSFGDTELRGVKWAQSAGIPIMLDADYYDPAFEEHAADITLFIGSEHYFRAWQPELSLEDKLARLYEKGPEVVIVTLGEKGSMVMDDTGVYTVPAFEVPVVDTTGAGDVFHGAYIYAYLQGWSHRDCTLFASATAALKCTKPGGRAGIPTVEEVLRLLRSRNIDLGHRGD